MNKLDAIIRNLKNDDDRELRAYTFNELGIFLGKLGDDRCIECFENACRLTDSPGNKMRMLGRLGDAYCLIRQDWDRAEKFYQACISVGDRANCNPLHVWQARFRLNDLELDRRGKNREFEEMRGTIILNSESCEALVGNLEIPSL
ncbi:MAG: hypothetical protein COB53_09545 [Elusimicrobia bacterium]|nr:MAG: hypothetical protein COB53_09545 [Elusimicrobiota bacterium]